MKQYLKKKDARSTVLEFPSPCGVFGMKLAEDEERNSAGELRFRPLAGCLA